jgi:3-oxoacyl-[acyl-carrier protein] reductase
MTRFAFVFPGQGSQSVGMMAPFEALPQVRQVFGEASAILGQDLWSLTANGPAEELNRTVNTQPVMLTAGYALLRAWRAAGGPEPALLAGHSLGEYAALVASQALCLQDALPLVRFRAQAMQEAVPEGTGGIAAILGLDDDAIRSVCADAAQGQVLEAANFNAPSQVVIAGHRQAVERGMELAKARGAKRALLLPMSVPSHCSLMRDAAARLAERLAGISLQPPRPPRAEQRGCGLSRGGGAHQGLPGAPAALPGALGGMHAGDAAAWYHARDRMRTGRGPDRFEQAQCSGHRLRSVEGRRAARAAGAAAEVDGDGMKPLEGKFALVTGASRGIGRAIALELGRQGAAVAGTATSEVGAAAITRLLAGDGIRGKGYVLDVADEAAMQHLIESTQSEFGRLYALVNNAGITRDNLLMRMKDEEWDEIMNVNLKSVFRLCRLVVRDMLKAREGRIVNVTSVSGEMGNAGQTNYAAAKAGVVGFSKALAREIGSRNVTVNCVAPGFIDTDMTRALPQAQRQSVTQHIPLARFGTPEEVAAAVAFLASPAAAYITGATLDVNGGMLMR